MVTWAYIYEHPGTDPATDRTELRRDGQRTLLVPVPGADDVVAAARQLVDEDAVTLIELCGGLPLAVAAQVSDAVGPDVAVGHVTFAVDTIRATAAFNARFEVDVLDEPVATAP